MANEEALHLILAAFIGILGGFVNLLFLYFVELIQWIIFQKTGDSAFLARDAGPFLRVFVPIKECVSVLYNQGSLINLHFTIGFMFLNEFNGFQYGLELFNK